MIHDLALRWLVTLLFVFSFVVCVQTIMAHRHSASNVISHSMHAVMAVAMALMAWPRGAELPPRAPMLIFAAATMWFAVPTLLTTDHRVLNAYHTGMMAAMAWMFAAMGGIPLHRAESSNVAAMAGMRMADMPGMDVEAGPAGHAGQSGDAIGTGTATWIAILDWLCTVGFAVAAVFWLYTLITERKQPSTDSTRQVGLLCQLATATGMAIMFGSML